MYYIQIDLENIKLNRNLKKVSLKELEVNQYLQKVHTKDLKSIKQGLSQKNLKTLNVLGALLVIIIQLVKKTPRYYLSQVKLIKRKKSIKVRKIVLKVLEDLIRIKKMLLTFVKTLMTKYQMIMTLSTPSISHKFFHILLTLSIFC